MSKLKQLLMLFLTMLKIGLFTFGGGYAMIALLQNEFVEKKKWLEKEEFLNMVAIAESTPGPIAVNSATYIGYKMARVWGSVFATIGVCLPSFVIIFVISLFLEQFMSLTYVAYAFKGIQVCVTYLILSAGIKMLKGLKPTAFNIIILVSTIVCMIALSLFAISFSSIYYILISGALGLIIYLIAFCCKKKQSAQLATSAEQIDKKTLSKDTKTPLDIGDNEVDAQAESSSVLDKCKVAKDSSNQQPLTTEIQSLTKSKTSKPKSGKTASSKEEGGK